MLFITQRLIQKLFNFFLTFLLVGLGIFTVHSPVLADEGVDPYVRRYLASEPVDIPANNQGQTQQFSPEDLTTGKTEARLSPSSLGRSGIAREPTGEQINLCYDFEYTPQECE